MLGYTFITDNVRNSYTATWFNHAKDFLYQLLLIAIMNQI